MNVRPAPLPPPSAARAARRPPSRLGRVVRTASALSWLAAASCAPAVQTAALVPSQPWDGSLADVFDDGVDYVTPLRTILGTPWFDEYGRQLERRLAESDIVAVVHVRSIEPSPSGHGYGAVEVVLQQLLHGTAASGTTLALDVAAGSDSATRLDAEQQRIRRLGDFVAYIRLYADPLGVTRTHWHLSPRDNDLLSTIRRTLAAH